MHSNAAVVINKAQLAEMVQEDAYTRLLCTDHLGQAFLRNLWNQSLELIWFAKLRHQQEYSRQTFLTGVEELIQKIGFGSASPEKKIFEENIREGTLLMHHAEHFPSLYLQGSTLGN